MEYYYYHLYCGLFILIGGIVHYQLTEKNENDDSFMIWTNLLSFVPFFVNVLAYFYSIEFGFLSISIFVFSFVSFIAILIRLLFRKFRFYYSNTLAIIGFVSYSISWACIVFTVIILFFFTDSNRTELSNIESEKITQLIEVKKTELKEIKREIISASVTRDSLILLLEDFESLLTVKEDQLNLIIQRSNESNSISNTLLNLIIGIISGIIATIIFNSSSRWIKSQRLDINS